MNYDAYLGNSGGSGHGYGEQLRESIDRHYKNKRWSGHDGLVDYYADCKICGKKISAFSMYKFEVHLVEEHKIKEDISQFYGIKNALKKLRRLADEAKADAEKYYNLENPELVDMMKTRELAYKTALSKLEEEIK
jgi:hypothetical protein